MSLTKKNKTLKNRNKTKKNYQENKCGTFFNSYNTFEDKLEKVYGDIFSSEKFNLEKLDIKDLKKAVSPSKINPQNDFYSYINERWLNEKKLELGDLVCYARQDGVTYNTTGSYASHCDIVVSIDGNSADGIGGNVSDTVSKKKIPLVNGFVKEGDKRFVLIKTK